MTDIAPLTSTVVNAANQPDLRGNLMPSAEELTVDRCHVDGTVPTGLRGTFIRNGPNPMFEPLSSYHMFDGDGMLHGVTFGDDGVSYKNRWIRSKGLGAELRNGQAVYSGLSEVMHFPGRELTGDAGPIKNPANTHIIGHAGRLLALWEGGVPTEVTAALDTVGEFDFDGKLVGAMTAHPRLDPSTGELFFFAYSLFEPYLRYHVADASGALIHSVDIDLPAPVMMHDFVVTEHYSIFFDAPAVFDLDRMLQGGDPMTWKPDNGTRIGVIPRGGSGGDVRWFEVDNCYVVHFFNAWESGTTIEIRAPRMPDMPGGFQFDNPGAAREPMPWRWTIDLATGTVTDSQVSDLASEFPRVNDLHAVHPTRYGYACPQRTWDFAFDFEGVIKYDFQTGDTHAHYYRDSQVSGEHAFAPDPAGTAEDDGWLLSFVTDRETEQSELIILDARDVEAEPVARVKMAARVPIGFHANWFAD